MMGRWRAWLVAVLLIALAGGGPACGGTSEGPKFSHLAIIPGDQGGAVQLMVTAPKTRPNLGTAVRVRVTATNNSGLSFTLDTAGRPVPEPASALGLAEPRPAIDLIMKGVLIDIQQPSEGTFTHSFERYGWVWSEQVCPKPAARLTLAPGESRVLIDVVWRPPPGRLVEGDFVLRAGATEQRLALSTQMFGGTPDNLRYSVATPTTRLPSPAGC